MSTLFAMETIQLKVQPYDTREGELYNSLANYNNELLLHLQIHMWDAHIHIYIHLFISLSLSISPYFIAIYLMRMSFTQCLVFIFEHNVRNVVVSK